VRITTNSLAPRELYPVGYFRMANAQKHVLSAVFPPYIVVSAKKSYSLLCKNRRFFSGTFYKIFLM